MIYIVGSLNVDLTIQSPYMPKEGETLTGGDFLTACGGKGANQAYAAAKLGGTVKMCGAVGDDIFGKMLTKNLASVSVDISHVKETKGVSTGVAVIVVTNGNNRIILDKGANATLDKADIDNFLSDAKAGDIFLTQLENPIDIVGYGLTKAKEKGLFTILNPAPANDAIADYFHAVDLITPNETELEIFGGVEELFRRGIRKVVTTLGGRGYEIADVRGHKVYPCRKVDVVDTTAAGDTLCGGLAVGLADGKSLEASCFFGSLAASLACTKRGAQQSVPSKAEVLQAGSDVTETRS